MHPIGGMPGRPHLTLLLLLLLLLLVTSCTSSHQPSSNIGVMVDISEHGAHVVHARYCNTSVAEHRELNPPKSVHYASEKTDGEIHVHFHSTPERWNLRLDADHMYTFKDPRHIHVHGWNPETERFESGTEQHKRASIHFVVPPHVRHVVVTDQHLETTFVVPLPSHSEVSSWGRAARRHNVKSGRFHGLSASGYWDTDRFELIDSSLPSDGSPPVPLPRGGPVDTQQNFVFLSGGYPDSEQGKKKFRQDLDHVVKILYTSCSDCDNAESLYKSVPYRRYITSFNVFAVWEPSKEAGASMPTRGISVNDNLECSYGTVVERALYCNPNLVLALADTAPCGALDKTNVVAIVLVNAEHYGGAASYRPTMRVGSFSTGYFNLDNGAERGKFSSLFFHETGHCYADLMDEYDTTQSETSQIKYSNCHWSGDSKDVPWRDWINFQSDPNGLLAIDGDNKTYYEVDTTPNPVCGWTNYYRSTRLCLMEKLTINGKVPRLCPVCREATVLMFYKTNRDANKNSIGMDITNPKCPLTAENLFIGSNPGDGVYLFINDDIATKNGPGEGGPVYVEWKCGQSGDTLRRAKWMDDTTKPLVEFNRNNPEQSSYVFVTPDDVRKCGGGTNVAIDVQVVVRDKTSWVLEDKHLPQMTQEYKWKVTMVDNPSGGGREKKQCIDTKGGSQLPSAVQPYNIRMALEGKLFDNGALVPSPEAKMVYYSTCEPGANCTIDYSARSYPPNVQRSSNAIEDVESLVFGIPGAIALAFVLLFLASWWCMSRKYAFARVKSVFVTKYDGRISLIRRMIIISGSFFMIVALCALGLGLHQYNQVGVFLKLVLIAALVLAILLFIMAFVGTSAAYFRAMGPLFLNAFGLFMSLLVMVFATYIVHDIGANIDKTACPVAKDSNATSLTQECAYQDADVSLCGFRGVGCELRSLWKALVKSHPEKICAFQEELSCSGYVVPCNRQTSVDYCPQGCDDVNVKYGDACKVKLQDDIKENCELLGPIMIGLSIVMFIAFLNNFLLAFFLRKQRKEQRKLQGMALKRLNEKSRKGAYKDRVPGTRSEALRLLKSLDQEQRRLLSQRFQQADKDGNGTVDKKELGMFLRSTLSCKITQADIDEAFRYGDRNGDGELSFFEFTELFDPGNSAEMKVAPKGTNMNLNVMVNGGATGGTDLAPGSPSSDYRRLDTSPKPLVNSTTSVPDSAMSRTAGRGVHI